MNNFNNLEIQSDIFDQSSQSKQLDQFMHLCITIYKNSTTYVSTLQHFGN
jgi:hypothetical protein